MTNEEIEQLDISKEYAKSLINKGEALKRLLQNPDYKLVISEGYFKEYPREIAEAVANNTGGYDSDKLIENLKCINNLKGYEFMISAQYDAGIQTLQEIEDYIANSIKDETEE